jgi:two-component system nitrate/nitrite response regulator NarL
MECRGRRGNGDIFMAETWFSTYKEGSLPKLAAIIGEIAEERVPVQSPQQAPDLGQISLSDREVGVLRSVVQGLANKQIAIHLDISESAVKNTLQQVFTKTGVRSCSQLVRIALEQYRNLL